MVSMIIMLNDEYDSDCNYETLLRIDIYVKNLNYYVDLN